MICTCHEEGDDLLCPVHSLYDGDKAFEAFKAARSNLIDGVQKLTEDFSKAAYKHGVMQGRIESLQFMTELNALVQTVPCELCEIKGGSNVDQDGGCRHRGRMTMPEILSRAAREIKRLRKA